MSCGELVFSFDLNNSFVLFCFYQNVIFDTFHHSFNLFHSLLLSCHLAVHFGNETKKKKLLLQELDSFWPMIICITLHLESNVSSFLAPFFNVSFLFAFFFFFYSLFFNLNLCWNIRILSLSNVVLLDYFLSLNIIHDQHNAFKSGKNISCIHFVFKYTRLKPYSHEHTTRSFVVSALMLSEVVLAKSSFYTAIHWDLSDYWFFFLFLFHFLASCTLDSSLRLQYTCNVSVFIVQNIFFFLLKLWLTAACCR